MKWINAEDMPECCGMPLLLVGINRYGQRRAFQGFADYLESGKLLFRSNVKDIDIEQWDITHWMPFPTLPAASPFDGYREEIEEIVRSEIKRCLSENETAELKAKLEKVKRDLDFETALIESGVVEEYAGLQGL